MDADADLRAALVARGIDPDREASRIDEHYAHAADRDDEGQQIADLRAENRRLRCRLRERDEELADTVGRLARLQTMARLAVWSERDA